MRSSPISTLGTVLFTIALAFLPAMAEARIAKPIKGKKYHLTKHHGPWMIMVSNLHGTTPEQLAAAKKAADALVYELRTKGIPAYAYSREVKLGSLETRDRIGRTQTRSLVTQRNEVAVLAGNYPSVDDSVGQKTLEWIKRMMPKSLEGGYFRPTPGKPNPFSRAILTQNPMLSPEELTHKKDNKLLRKLNLGSEYNLADNPGKYTLVVASFYGNSISTMASSTGKMSDVKRTIENIIKKTSGLDGAALRAFQLVRLMRAQGNEAYIFHQRYKSIVTVGSFNSPQNPRIPQLVERFRVKIKENRLTGEKVPIAETFTIREENGAWLMWPLDPQPRLIEVPRI